MPFKFPLGVPILNGFTHLKKVLSSVVRNLKAKQTLDLCKIFFFFVGEMFGLGDLLTRRSFGLHLLQLPFNKALISNTEEMTIKIIQNKATFPFILTL